MKKAFITVAAMIGIIGIRMILSIAVSEQAAEVFTRFSISFLFFYFICGLSAGRRQAASQNAVSRKL
ncbi:MAG: hypothetical protein HFI53_06765 [Lachnospiraceae bacterium]|nr:hypothetical protein [Lachnospiraceae bacterium]